MLAYDEKTGRRVTALLKVPRLRSGAVPSILPNCPAYLGTSCSTRPSPETKKARLEEAALSKALSLSITDQEEYVNKIAFKSLEELLPKLQSIDTDYWTIINRGDSLFICRVDEHPSPNVKFSVVMKPSCAVHVYLNKVEVTKLGKYKIPNMIADTNTLDELLENLRQFDASVVPETSRCSVDIIQLVLSLLTLIVDESFQYVTTLKFLCEQLYLMTLKKFSYSSEFLIFSSLLYNCSPSGYRLLREKGFLILPHWCTIRRILLSKYCSPATEHEDENLLCYIKTKFKSLQAVDKTVMLLIDEIHIKPYFDYKCGNIVGSAFNSKEAATTAFVFMVSSIASAFKDVVHIIPTRCMKADLLHNLIKKVIIGLEKIGFTVICVITDNNAINGKAVSLLSDPPTLSIVYPHPAQSNRPLFFMFDSVHLLKCVRNNWLNQRDVEKTMRFPQFTYDEKSDVSVKILLSPFQTLEKLYSLEADSLLKHSYKLSHKALCPIGIERQNFKYVQQIFNEYTIEALLSLGMKHKLSCYAEVAEFIKKNSGNGGQL